MSIGPFSKVPSQINRPRISTRPQLFTLALVICLLASPFQACLAGSPGPLDPARMEAFFDGLIRGQLKAFHSPGAAVVLVQDGRVILSKSWGLADPAAGRPIDPKESVYQTGSLSKVVTDMAVLQLHGQGRLDIHADIRKYLGDFQLQTRFPQPITLSHLMTHTAGFELRVDGILTRTPEGLQPLDRWLSENHRLQVRPPGSLTAYSNFDHTLAGYIVERVSGLPFADYMDQKVLQPLGMESSSYRQPVPQKMAARMIRGHVYKDGRLRPVPQGLFQIAPSGGLASTPQDLARLMTALLDGGRIEGRRVLREDETRLMLSSQHKLSGRPGGLSFGFNEIQQGRRLALYHGGLFFGVYNIMLLLPESRIGLVVVYNCESAFWGIYDILPLFMDYLFPDDWKGLRPKPHTPAELDKFKGYYLPTSLKGSSFEPLLIPRSAARLSPTGQGTLLSRWDWQSRPMEMIRIGESDFQETNDLGKVSFLKGDGDEPQKFYFYQRPTITFVRLPWYETPPFQILMVVLNGMIFLAALFLWPVLLRPGRAGPEGRPLSRAGLAAALGSGIYLLMLAGILSALRDVFDLAYGFGPFLRLALNLPYAGAAAALITLILLIRVWRLGSGGLGPRLFYSLSGLSLVLFTLWLAYWRFF